MSDVWVVVLDVDYEGSSYAGTFSTEEKAAAWMAVATLNRCSRFTV
jgi:hypothetical protein